jgi:hypothetical protein
MKMNQWAASAILNGTAVVVPKSGRYTVQVFENTCLECRQQVVIAQHHNKSRAGKNLFALRSVLRLVRGAFLLLS